MPRTFALALLLSLAAVACHRPPTPAADAALADALPDTPAPDWPAILPGAVDLLFVIDTSPSMEQEQASLRVGPRLYWLLSQLADAGKLVDLHVGVISGDLGAGSLKRLGCAPGGDGAKLRREPLLTSCTAPKDPWLSYLRGELNVPSTGAPDAVGELSKAFDCIADLSPKGCGWEQQLEAARRALDPALQVNPGFLRPGAALAVFFFTNEDDCSASDPGLFEPSDAQLGPETSYRCSRFGVVCDEPLDSVGTKHHCRPGGTWLRPVEEYVSFFKKLKPPGRVLVSAIAGPPEPFVVDTVLGANGSPLLHLKESCTDFSVIQPATPALRLQALVAGVGGQSFFNQGLFNTKGEPDLVGSLTPCTTALTPAMLLLGRRIAAMLP